MKERRKIVLYIAQSLDGYIATEDDSLDWLFRMEGEGDNGFGKFHETIDTEIVGRRTYDWVMEHENGNYPSKEKKCYVMTGSTTVKNENVTFVNNDIVGLTNRLKREEGKNIWLVGGGELIHAFLEENLIDEIYIQIAPSLIGKGIPLFKRGDYEIDLELKDISRYNQMAQLHYEVKK
ncbi:dihydrofolate reductase family protein [Pseudalkalibacillus caeni]|uniref:Dihydrofolate reductase n=1 Tax=Exobacillus caeni TaxID=2574798 RepID=A0A5R9F3B3_9BACL|nr:dihydrofolate reductase family protein [Pseudalkalibacillus caeni]TLS36826.1 dihydrofolate reductase [Pseudalkalibacillus caeni]